MPTLDSLRQLLEDRAVLAGVTVSALVILVVLLLRSAAMRWVRATRWAVDEDRLRWAAVVRRSTILAVLLGLLLIWGDELRTFAVSIIAIAAALVLATKEVIVCMTGGILRASAQSFTLGSRVEIAGFRGDVIDTGMFTTTLRETGPGHQWTGRAVVFPNSVFLTTSVINETFTEEFVLHLISFPLTQEEDFETAERVVLEAANEVCAEYLDEAKRHMDRLALEHGLPSPSMDPRVTLQIPEAGKLNLLVRVPTRAREKGRVEQRIVRAFIDSRDA